MPGRWVLLVSAEAALLDAVERCLEGSGLRVAISADPEQAAAQARDLRPALIITDVKFDADVPLMLIRETTKLERLRRQVDDFLNPAPPPAPAPFLGGGIKISPPPRRGGRRWVLLINENPGLEAAVEEALAGSGLHLTTAPSAALAVVQARDLRPVLIVSDFPEEMLTELRREPAAVEAPFLPVKLPFEPAQFKALARRMLAAAGEEAL